MILGSIAFLMMILLGILFALAIPILIGVFVYRDASRRQDCSPILWALVAALVPAYVGLIVYLIVRNDYPLRPEFGGPQPGTQNTYYQQQSYQSGPVRHNSIPTWGKVLIIVGVVLVAICVIVFAVNAVYSIGSMEHSINLYDNTF
jgi:Ni/Fe-hydrogenase subunit HybB-like protein